MRLRGSLDEFVIDSIETTLPFCSAFLHDADFVDGNYDVHWLEQFLARGVVGREAAPPPQDVDVPDNPRFKSGDGMMLNAI